MSNRSKYGICVNYFLQGNSKNQVRNEGSTKEPPSVYSYIARVHGVVAGVCALVIDEKFNNCSTGGLYDGCVLPEFRKLGVGTAMACYRIKVAQALGLQSLSIVLMSDGMARGYCNRLGFKKHHVMTPYYIF